jgi:acyl-CoA synthetase (AMP-forming)/AMP-acid ligase II
VLAGQVPWPLDDEREGREMLYSSGTTGRPKGVRKQLPGTAFGDPASAPAQIAQGRRASPAWCTSPAGVRSNTTTTRPRPNQS